MRWFAALALGGLLVALLVYAISVIWGAGDPDGWDTDGWR